MLALRRRGQAQLDGHRIIKMVQPQRLAIHAQIQGCRLGDLQQLQQQRRSIIGMNPVGPVRPLPRHAHMTLLQAAQPLQPPGSVDAPQPHHHPGLRTTPLQQLLGFQQHPAIEAQRLGHGALIAPLAIQITIDGGGRHQHHPPQIVTLQPVQQMAEALHENGMVTGRIPRPWRGRVHHGVNAARQGGQGFGAAQIGLDPGRRGGPGGRRAAQAQCRLLPGLQTGRDTQAQITAASQKHGPGRVKTASMAV